MKLSAQGIKGYIKKVIAYIRLLLKNILRDLKTVAGKIQEYPLATLFFIGSVLFLFLYPYLQVGHWGINNVTEAATLENEYRATLAQMLGGVAIGIGLYFTWKKILISQDGQITERFTRAVDQLGALDQKGNPVLEIRLGGIYALERISKESKDDYWPIIEILTAYIRKNSSAETVGNKNYTPISMFIQDESKKRENSEVKNVSLDIQAILTVITKHEFPYNNEKDKVLNLGMTWLKGADLREAHLEGANLKGAHLEGANFYKADLSGANFYKADLSGTHLNRANLTKACLREADLRKANLRKANLRGTDLIEANFTGADLSVVNLSRPNLTEAYIREADLNLIIEQFLQVKTLYKAELDEELRKQLEEKYPEKYQELIKNPEEQ